MTDAAVRPSVVAGPRRVGVGGRIAGVVVAAVCLTLLVTAARLNPSPDGHGTHRGLGLPPCGWVVAFDKPCPTCGMTTAFAHAVRLDLWASARAQPLGMLLAAVAGVGFWGGLHVGMTGSRLGPICATILGPRSLWLFGALALAAWAYKLATWAP